MYTSRPPVPASLDVTARGQADDVAEASIRARRVSLENLSVGTDRGKPGRGRWPPRSEDQEPLTVLPRKISLRLT